MSERNSVRQRDAHQNCSVLDNDDALVIVLAKANCGIRARSAPSEDDDVLL
jgi:hypothetical protein